LSCEIKKSLRDRPNRNQHISLICPNGVNYVIGQWAIWMSGNIVVPLSGQHTLETLENFIGDTDSAMVITAPSLMDKVEKVTQKTGKPLLCQDPKGMSQTNINIDDVTSPLFNDNLYPKDEPVMMFYMPGDSPRGSRLYLTHKDLNREIEMVNTFWKLDKNSSILHALSLYNPYGVIASLMSPLSVGGRIVLLPQFDTMKVWSHLLGMQINGEHVPRINMFAGVPIHYESLISRYQEIFKDSNHKTFVRDKCSERVKLMTNGIKYMDYNVHKEWAKITGHQIKLAY